MPRFRPVTRPQWELCRDADGKVAVMAYRGEMPIMVRDGVGVCEVCQGRGVVAVVAASPGPQ